MSSFCYIDKLVYDALVLKGVKLIRYFFYGYLMLAGSIKHDLTCHVINRFMDKLTNL